MSLIIPATSRKDQAVGLFDSVTCDLPMPDDREVVKDSFQTKSLWRCMDLFTITSAGRLIFHKRRYCFASDPDARPPEHVADIDMDYHGDIEIHGATREEGYYRYAVRFTHGTVEWIRPVEELSELHRTWLTEKGW
jgi:hypothetical protein